MKDDGLTKFLTEISPGHLSFGSARMALLDIESGFWEIRRQMESLIGDRLTDLVLQQAGTNGGASFARSFHTGNQNDGATFFSACLQAYQAAGFGQFDLISVDWPIGRIQIQATNAFEAWMLRQRDKKAASPKCSYSAGVFVGFVNIIAGRQDVVCVEHSCQAKGDKTCLFELIPAAQAKGQAFVPFTPAAELGTQLNLLEMLFERMPMGIAILDREYRVQRFNPTWANFADRYAPPSGKPLIPGVGYFEHLPGSEPVVMPMFEEVLAGETIQRNGQRLESEGIVTYWDIVLAPLIEDGKVVGILNVAVDATERVTLRQNLEQRVEERTSELNRKREIAESLRDIIGMINANLPIEQILDRAVKIAAQRLGAAACVLHQFDMVNNEMIHMAGYGTDDIYQRGTRRHFSDLKSSGAETYLNATLQRQPSYANYPPLPDRVEEIRNDPAIPEAVKTWRIMVRQRFAGAFTVPLVIQNKVYGGMAFYYAEPQDYTSELIQLGLTFAEQVAVAIENARLHQAEQDRQRELSILLEVAATASSSLNLDEVLTETLDLVVALLGASRTGVILLDENSGELVPYLLRPQREIEAQDLDRMVAACKSVIDDGELLYIAPDVSQGLMEPGALLPLQVRGRKLGVLGIIGPELGSFTPEQLTLFKSIADQLSVAIENASLFDKAEEAAISAERNRLARDLHDAVTQTLFSASMIADVLPRIWDRSPDEGRRRLEELRQLTRGALSEMRTLLVELRPAALVDTDLGDLINHQVNAFIARTRLQVKFERSCTVNPPPEIKEAFYRITQEAFNNIAKHAEATVVTVRLECQADRSVLTIEDNGIGFNVGAISMEGLGVGIMHERARNAGITLELHSKIQEGTRLYLLWQAENRKENNDG